MGAISISHSISGDTEDSGIGSDIGELTNSEEEIYGGRYSIDSSPQDGSSGGRFENLNSRQQLYRKDPVYIDFSSSRETAGGGRHPIGEDDYTDDETTDSLSFGFSIHMESKKGDLPLRRSYPAENSSSSSPLQAITPASMKVIVCFGQFSDYVSL